MRRIDSKAYLLTSIIVLILDTVYFFYGFYGEFYGVGVILILPVASVAWGLFLLLKRPQLNKTPIILGIILSVLYLAPTYFLVYEGIYLVLQHAI